GEVKAKYVKRHLPNYGVFDEFRNFVAGEGTLVVRFHGIDIGIAICEDIWRDEGPMQELAARNPGLVLVPNGSPYERSKDDLRLELVRKRATQIGAPLVYTNMFGGQDDLVFDGDSMVVAKSGELLARSPQFKEDLLIVDIEVEASTAKPDLVISEKLSAPSGQVQREIAAPLTDLKPFFPT
ncbi:MAG: nitrilase-related carbon-nitrogen hydrolase, partial [Actinomycetota bacterium]